ncbi:MAG: AMP-dependent synthetase/ligase [Candidatus Gastranaerophilaceae bacterium]
MKENVLSLLDQNTKLYGERIALGKKNKYGWKELTYKGLGLLAKQFASYLITDLQMQKGEKLAILSESMPEIGACLFASVISGMVTVPLDNKLTIYELESILSSCEPSVLAVSQANVEKALELKKRIPSIKHLILMEEPKYNSTLPSIYSLNSGTECKWRHRSLRDTALIIYTSGTTGAPKGVQTTFGNMITQVIEMSKVLPEILPNESLNLLSILPMNHLFELTVGFSTFLNRGSSIFYPQSLKPKDVLADMREKKIDFMITVPAFLKLLKTTIEADIRSLPEEEKILFEKSYAAAEYITDYSIKRQLFRSILAKFGGNFYGFISGGAPLDPSVGEFFERIGIKIFQGYGLSETSPVISMDRGEDRKLLSVGPVLDSYDAKIDPETGELLVKGPSVMKGYYNNPEKTAEVLEPDGWLHTGDIGEFDEDGRLYITGRIKNMIVLSGGKKVFPEEVEAVLEDNPNFAEICVFGATRTSGAKDGTEEIMTVVVPTQSVMDTYTNEDDLYNFICKEVKELSVRLASYKRPVNIVVRKEPLPRTSTRKVKRNIVKEETLAITK